MNLTPTSAADAITITRASIATESDRLTAWRAANTAEPPHRRVERLATALWCTTQRHQQSGYGTSCNACATEVRHALNPQRHVQKETA